MVKLVTRRIGTLGPETQAVLRAAAVLGLNFSARVVAEVCQDQTGVHRALEEALRNNLVEPRGGDTYGFVYYRVLESALDGIDRTSLADLHQKAADALEKIGDDLTENVFALARHYGRGHVEQHRERVVEVSLRAGEAALRNFSNPEAHALLECAFDSARALDLRGDDMRRLRELLGTACSRIGKQPEARAHFEAVLAEEQLDTLGRGRMQLPSARPSRPRATTSGRGRRWSGP